MEIETDLTEKFPGLQVLSLEMNELQIMKSDQKLDAFRKEAQEKVRQKIGSAEEIRDLPVLRAYRDFFWRVGIDPTKIRPAGEALIRRVILGRDLPSVNTLVDSYNIASLETSIAVAAFDKAKVTESDLLMRKAGMGESFLGIGMPLPHTLSGVEIVIEDRKPEKLIAVYPYRDSDDSKVTLQTKDALLLMCGVPGIELEILREAMTRTERYITRFCKQHGSHQEKLRAHSF